MMMNGAGTIASRRNLCPEHYSQIVRSHCSIPIFTILPLQCFQSSEFKSLNRWWDALSFSRDYVMAKSTVKLDKDLIARVKKCSELAGYASAEEFIEHLIEKELARLEDAESDEAIVKKLKGLGYLE